MRQRILIITLFSLVLAALTLFQTGCDCESTQVMTLQEAQAMADLYAEARNTSNLDLLDSIYAANVFVTDPSMPEEIRGLESLKEHYIMMQSAFTDFQIAFDQVHVANDVIIFSWTVTGTNTGQFGTLPPTGKRVQTSGVAISRIENGKIVEDRVVFNMLDVFEQLGCTLVVPEEE